MNEGHSLVIEEFAVGPGEPCLVIAEVAQGHDGSLGMAHAFIDLVAGAGANAIKFQTHIASAESTPAEPWRKRFSPQDQTRFDYWKRTEFSREQWQGLASHARDRGLIFLSSPFSQEAVRLLMSVGVPAWKIASGEVANTHLIDAVSRTRLPVILSSGLSTYAELDEAVVRLQNSGVPLAVLQCTTAYPCPPEAVGLNVMEAFRDRYRVPVGLSDHSGEVYPGLAAVARGADVLEVHVTFHREMFGPDVSASLTPEQLKDLVRGVRFVERMLKNPVRKDEAAEQAEPLRRMFTKSVVAGQDLPAGTVLEITHLAFKKPGTGIPTNRTNELLGRTLRAPVKADEQLLKQHLQPEKP